jgi:hypothetical protein
MDGGVAAILAAIIAAAIGAIGAIGATISMIISKENKISEFRQLWISELRTAFSEYLPKAVYLYRTEKKADELYKEKEIFNKKVIEIQLRMNYLNPSEDEEILSGMIAELGRFDTITNDDELRDFIDDFMMYSAKILKSEWKRVKAGESKYRVFMYTSLTLSISLFILAAIYIYNHFGILWAFIKG